MKRLTTTSILLAAILATMAACNKKPMSILVKDESKGFNGSFEHSKEGLPVNWQLYTDQTVPDADFDITLDTTDAYDGKQSLRFDVRQCSATGGWQSPGIARQLKAQPGEIYKLNFRVKNRGSKFIATIAGVSATKGTSETIASTDETINGWKQYEYTYTLPEKMKAIRLQVNVLQPGTFLIDDVHIYRVKDSAH